MADEMVEVIVTRKQRVYETTEFLAMVPKHMADDSETTACEDWICEHFDDLLKAAGDEADCDTDYGETETYWELN
jgi:hypothetical protein